MTSPLRRRRPSVPAPAALVPAGTAVIAVIAVVAVLALLLLGALTGCGTTPVDPTPTAVATADRPAPDATASASAESPTTPPPTAAGTAALVAEVVSSSAALGEQIAGDDHAGIQQARAAMVQAIVRLDRAADWTGVDADLTTADLLVSARQAVVAAQQRVGAGTAVASIELDVDDLRLTWDVELSTAGGDVDVEVDARTGEVVEVDG